MKSYKRLSAYLESIKIIFVLLMKAPKALLLGTLCVVFISKIIFLVAFVLSIKFISNAEVLRELTGGFVGLEGWVFIIASLLVVWTLSIRQFKILLAHLEKSVAMSLLNEIGFRGGSGYAGVAGIDNGPSLYELSKMPWSISQLCSMTIMALLTVPVMVLVLAALFYVDPLFTSFLFMGMLFVWVLIPNIQKKNRLVKEESKKAGSKNAKAISALLSGKKVTKEKVRENLEKIDSFGDTRVLLAKSGEASTFLVNLFIAATLTILLLWFAYNSDQIEGDQLSNLIIYLILMRFFSSYVGSFIRTLGAINISLYDLVKLKSYLNSQRLSGVRQPKSKELKGIFLLSVEYALFENKESMVNSIKGFVGGIFRYSIYDRAIADIYIKCDTLEGQSPLHHKVCEYLDIKLDSDNSVIEITPKISDVNYRVCGLALKSKLEGRVLILPDSALISCRNFVFECIEAISKHIPVFVLTNDEGYSFDQLESGKLKQKLNPELS